MFRPGVMLELATTFTTVDERNILDKTDIPMKTALLIVFSAKESLFKALYPQSQHIFRFEAAKLCEIELNNNFFSLELTRQLAPGLCAGYRITGHYLIGDNYVTTIVITAALITP